jgi:hypothetical protein
MEPAMFLGLALTGVLVVLSWLWVIGQRRAAAFLAATTATVIYLIVCAAVVFGLAMGQAFGSTSMHPFTGAVLWMVPGLIVIWSPMLFPTRR